MKTTISLSFLFIILLSSCTTVYYTKSYEDANYLTQDEFAEYEDYTKEDSEYQNDEVMSDTSEEGTVINNYYGDYYETDGHYDYSYSARIRRFHRPVWSIGYYGGLYTDYYWYSYNPYHCGMSIYYGYNYYDPFYSPYYSWGYSGYYSPYYSYYNHHYGHHHHHGNNHYNYTDTYSYNNSYDNNSIYYGPRGSLSSRSNSNRSVTNVSSSTNNKNSTYDKFNRAVDKKITERQIKNNPNKVIKTSTNRTVTKPNTSKSSATYKEAKTNTYKSNRSNTKTNTYKGNAKNKRTYTTPKSNSNRSYNNSRGSSTKSNGNSRSSRSSNSKNRSVKPRK